MTDFQQPGPSCWHLLGLAEQRQRQMQGNADDASILTERDVNKAYREKARETHPDRFRTAEEKERATIEFRRIHDAKDEALEAIRNPAGCHACDECFNEEQRKQEDEDHGHHCSGKKEQPDRASTSATSKYSDTAMQRTTTVMNDELDREFNERWDHGIRVALELLHQAWPDKEKAWAIWQSTTSFLSDLKSGLNADIYNYLEKRQDEDFDKFRKDRTARIQKLVKHAEDNWDVNREQLLREFELSWCILDFKDAIKMTTNPEIAKAMRDCHDGRMQQYYDKKTEQIKKAAADIASVFPDVPAIKRILDSLTYRDARKRVLDYLPDDMHKLMGSLLLES